MREKVFISLIIGGAAYIVVVLWGLFSGNTLNSILRSGLISLFIFFAIGLLFSIISEISSYSIEEEADMNIEEIERRLNDSVSEKDLDNFDSGQEEMAASSTDSSAEEEDFSPLNPPELEVNDRQEE